MFSKPKPHNSTTKMGAVAPLAIGTRGTIGALVRSEIEFFNKLDLDRTPSHAKRETSTSSSNGSSTFGCFFGMSWRKNKNKKKRKRSNNNGGSFLPTMCSAVDVHEGNNTFDRIPGFNYKSLKLDMENL